MKKCREEVDIYSKEQFELYMEIVEGVVQLLLQKPEKDSSYGDLHKYISSLEKYLKDLVKVHNSQASSEQDGNCSYPLSICPFFRLTHPPILSTAFSNISLHLSHRSGYLCGGSGFISRFGGQSQRNLLQVGFGSFLFVIFLVHARSFQSSRPEASVTKCARRTQERRKHVLVWR